MKKTYKISGMHCDSCAKMIELDLEDAGIAAKCDYAKECLEVEPNSDKQKIKEIVEASGYQLL
jgi:copper chaperone CopZ